MSSRRTALAICGGIVATGVGGAAGYLIANNSASDPAARAEVTPAMVSECGMKQPVTKPAEITMTCADGGILLHNIDWRYWSSDLAVGLASSRENTCDPSCAEGTMIDHAVNLVLFDVVSNGAGPQFTRATVTYQDEQRTYDGNQAITYDLSPYEPSP